MISIYFTTLEQVELLLDMGVVTVEAGAVWRPVWIWEEGPGGKRVMTDKQQESAEGVPLWDFPARVVTWSYGDAKHVDFLFVLESETRPEVGEELAREAGDVEALKAELAAVKAKLAAMHTEVEEEDDTIIGGDFS